MIDLHCHSHFSDGILSPATLFDKAIAANMQILALTDHDTVAGIAPLREAAKNSNLKIINGIELSVRWKKNDIHIIGLNINPDDAGLKALIIQQNDSRILRAKQIADCLTPFGIDDAYKKACEIAGHERVGRPHFAQILINAGVVRDAKTAFKRLLGRGKPAYVPTPWISVDAAVEGIVQAGGQAVIAHPLKYSLTRSKLHDLIITFKDADGVGIEVVSGEMTVSDINEVAGLCLRFGLLASTGSDYHGDAISRIALGQQRQLPLNCTPIWHQWTI